MRFLHLLGAAALGFSSVVSAASSWSFEDATVAVADKGASEPLSHKLVAGTPLTSSAIVLPASGQLKISLTTVEGKTGRKPVQAFLTLRESDSGLEDSYPFIVKDNGKAKLELSQKDLPVQLLTSSKPLKASIVLASFGVTTPYNSVAFTLDVEADASSSAAGSTSPERYISKPEIHHIFRADPRSPPKIISLVFTLAVIVALPALLGAWLLLGGNLAHAGKAFGANPLAHGLFFGSIVAMEGVFFMYYASWNLFQTLPAAGIVGLVAYVSGSRALTEVQERRLAGER